MTTEPAGAPAADSNAPELSGQESGSESGSSVPRRPATRSACATRDEARLDGVARTGKQFLAHEVRVVPRLLGAAGASAHLGAKRVVGGVAEPLGQGVELGPDRLQGSVVHGSPVRLLGSPVRPAIAWRALS